MPSGYKLSDVPSIYQPLFDFLAEADGDEVVLTYKEVAALIRAPLPTMAVLGTAWWTNKAIAHVQAWRALGWVAHSSAAHRRVRFTRDAENERGG